MLYVMTRTRFGLETRAVTQNPAMAASMGINLTELTCLPLALGPVLPVLPVCDWAILQSDF